MKYQMHSKIRNCGNQYPESDWAKKGYEVGPIRIFECPKTFVTQDAVGYVEAFDFSQSTGLPFVKDFFDLRADMAHACAVICNERSFIVQQQNQDKVKLNG